jgi:putative glycosyltransferase (TIGR04372 family)
MSNSKALRIFLARQATQISMGGWPVMARKIKLLIKKLFYLPLYLIAIPLVLVLRGLSPWLLVRIGFLMSSRIGLFAASTELYLLEKEAGINVPKQRYVDFFCLLDGPPVCNKQLRNMWARVIRIVPTFVLAPLIRINHIIPGGGAHDLRLISHTCRDVHNLYDRLGPRLSFSEAETKIGETRLRSMGIPVGAKIICLNVRDSAYLDSYMKGGSWNYHSYRNADIDTFLLSVDELAKRGYYVVRMGAIVNKKLLSTNPRIIDYAGTEHRDEFMDIYLGAKCFFCISTGAGWDAIPEIFRRPTVFVNLLPLGYLLTFRRDVLHITKHHWNQDLSHEFTLGEIFQKDLAFCVRTEDFEAQGARLVANSAEEIREVVMEMVERLEGTWIDSVRDRELQEQFVARFLENITNDSLGKTLHGRFQSRYGASFLSSNEKWLS